jgi:Mg2+/Co2+ transporter CorC
MVKRRPPPKKTTKEFTRFKDFLRRIVAVPRKEVDEKMKEFKSNRRAPRDSG